MSSLILTHSTVKVVDKNMSHSINFLAECQDIFILRGQEYGCEGSLVNHTSNRLYSKTDCENHCLKGNKDNCAGYFYLANQTTDGTDYYCYNYPRAPPVFLRTKQGGYYERSLCYQRECTSRSPWVKFRKYLENLSISEPSLGIL